MHVIRVMRNCSIKQRKDIVFFYCCRCCCCCCCFIFFLFIYLFFYFIYLFFFAYDGPIAVSCIDAVTRPCARLSYDVTCSSNAPIICNHAKAMQLTAFISIFSFGYFHVHVRATSTEAPQPGEAVLTSTHNLCRFHHQQTKTKKN